MAERAGAPLSSGLGRCVLRGVEAMDMPDNDSTGGKCLVLFIAALFTDEAIQAMTALCHA